MWRRGVRLLSAFALVTAGSMLLTISPAQALTSLDAIAQNPWILEDMAAQGMALPGSSTLLTGSQVAAANEVAVTSAAESIVATAAESEAIQAAGLSLLPTGDWVGIGATAVLAGGLGAMKLASGDTAPALGSAVVSDWLAVPVGSGTIPAGGLTFVQSDPRTVASVTVSVLGAYAPSTDRTIAVYCWKSSAVASLGYPTVSSTLASTGTPPASGYIAYPSAWQTSVYPGNLTGETAYANGGAGISVPVGTTSLTTAQGQCASGFEVGALRVSVGGARDVWVYHSVSTPSSPPRSISQTITCVNAAGASTTVTNTTAASVWGANQFRTLGPLMCPLSHPVMSTYDTSVVTAGGTTTSVTAGQGATGLGLPDACYQAGVCRLEVARITHTGAGVEVLTGCGSLGAACTKWSESASPELSYRCRYGSASVGWATRPLDSCSGLRKAYDETPVASAVVRSVPVTPTDPAVSDCSFGWSDLLNGGVVLKAVSCSLTWAFVPDPAVVETAASAVSVAWAGSGPAVIVSTANEVLGPFAQIGVDGPGDCQGPEVAFDVPAVPGVGASHQSWHPFAACTGPAAYVSGYWLPVCSLMLYVGSLFLAARYVGKTVGMEGPQDGN